jgi:SpoIIAA-like
MIETIENLPDNVVGLIAKGQVTRKDYEQVLIPKVEAALKRHAKIRLYYELGSQFSGIDPGAAWEDFKVGFEHLTRWERMAVVTDVEWIRHMINAFRFVMPGDLRVFATAQAADARAWILSTQA